MTWVVVDDLSAEKRSGTRATTILHGREALDGSNHGTGSSSGETLPYRPGEAEAYASGHAHAERANRLC